MIEAPLRDVVRAFESRGPKGGREIVHVLECGCWVINRRKVPAKRLRCISCRIREEQAGDGRHGEPRPIDIAWQAYQAGMNYWRLIGRFAFGDRPLSSEEITVVNKRFTEWWSRSR